MWTAIIGVIGTLFGVAVGGGITLFKDQAMFRQEKDWQRRQLLREKLEEICKAIEEINNLYRRVWVEMVAFLKRQKAPSIDITYLQLPRLSMLINFYVPELKDHLRLLDDTVILFSDALDRAVTPQELEEETCREIIKELTGAHKAIEKVCNSMTALSADLAKKYI